MGAKLRLLCLASALLAYWIYIPMSEDCEQPWKMMLILAPFRAAAQLAAIAEQLGLMHYMEAMKAIMALQHVAATSDENVTVTDTEFSGVPVRLFVPRKEPEGLRRAVIYFHGGGWCLGDAGFKSSDYLTRQTSNRLNAVVVSVNYRLAPKHHFPAQFEDVYSVTKFFLQSKVLSQYKVDPNRVCVAGDSAGGNLAAAVAQQLPEDPEVKTKLKLQALLYPALQTLDLNSPSYEENKDDPLLSKALMVRFWSEYFTPDASLREAMASNRHVPAHASHLLQLVNWSSLLPAEMRQGHPYPTPSFGSPRLAEQYPGFLEVRAAPLLASAAQLRRLPLTYLLTCGHDVLRDDGLMYAARLRAAGVPLAHQHFQEAFHGAMIFISGSGELAVGRRLLNSYIEWLDENL
ncbi:arylacetamide deacetylase [Indicator indicator]|uniref:arylacetamide deacetylase n=1 Tax=Indicator indicator TaxID=1002788 RepID=UPI0023DFFE5E|nr:arylacetamide deacetylase [Indicator indicator]